MNLKERGLYLSFYVPYMRYFVPILRVDKSFTPSNVPILVIFIQLLSEFSVVQAGPRKFLSEMLVQTLKKKYRKFHCPVPTRFPQLTTCLHVNFEHIRCIRSHIKIIRVSRRF